jgi:Membrane bound beta barrel domain (DUF5777)
MNTLKKLGFLTLLLFVNNIFSQDDLLKDIDSEASQEVTSAFKSLKIINFESTKLVAKKELFLVIAHRFDYIKNGFDNFFGLDNANTQIKFAYGLSDKITLQASRDGFGKTYDLSAKYLLINQKTNGFPFTIVGFNSIAVNSEMKEDRFPNLKFSNRLAYTAQLLVSRKFSDKLSLQIAPTFFHENTIEDINDSNNVIILPNPQDNSQYMIGLGGRYKLTNRLSINADYGLHLNRAKKSIYKNPLSIGMDLDTGGHIFQMHFTNAKAMHETGFMGRTSGDWGKSEIAFGFNLIRVF